MLFTSATTRTISRVQFLPLATRYALDTDSDARLTPPSQPDHNTNQPARDPRRALHRQCQRLRLLPRRGRADPALVPGDDLQVPVHGGEHPAPRARAAREDPGYQEDAGDGAVFEVAQRGIQPPRKRK